MAEIDPDEDAARQMMRSMYRPIGEAFGMLLLWGICLVYTLQKVVVVGLTPALFWGPVALYSFLGLAFARRGKIFLAALCLAGLISHLRVIPSSAKKLETIREERKNS